MLLGKCDVLITTTNNNNNGAISIYALKHRQWASISFYGYHSMMFVASLWSVLGELMLRHAACSHAHRQPYFCVLLGFVRMFVDDIEAAQMANA